MARSDSMPLTPLDIQRMEQETGLQMQLIPDQSYLRDRADAMSTVESNIVELGTIFNKLAVMVSEHREMVQRVEDNVEEANSNLTMSMNVLTDTLTSLKTNRALMGKVFGVLVLFIISFIIFFA
jgi:syntaxin 5